MSADRKAPLSQQVRGIAAVRHSTPAPSAAELFIVFAKIGISAIGGGLTAWIMREIVGRRRWLSDEEFLSGLAMSQALPGVNVVNLPIWVGYRLRGGAGAFAAALGMVLPTMLVISCVATGFTLLGRFRVAELAMAGAGSAAIGLAVATGLQAASKSARNFGNIVVLGAVFLGATATRLPLLFILAVAAPASIWLAWLRVR